MKLDEGRAFRKEREYSRARTALAQVVLRCAEPDVRSRALYVLAQLETISGRPTAGPLWEALARKYPQSTLADDAVYNQGVASRRNGELDKERALLQDLVNRFPSSDLRSDALFRLFWSRWSEGRPREGLVWLDQLAASPDSDGYEEERARYWRARSLLEPLEGESELARAAAREVARTDLAGRRSRPWLAEGRPLTYYGLLAHGRLAELDPERTQAIEQAQDRLVQTPAPRSLHAGALGRDPHLLAAIELLRLGLKTEAAREISAVDRSAARSGGEVGHEPLTLIAELYSRSGDLRSAHAIVRTELRGLLRRPASALALRAAALAYPLAFREQIARVSQGVAVPPDLLQALMREESALDPRALSPTGALGLTQVMPSTARMLARKLRLQGYQTARLLDPDRWDLSGRVVRALPASGAGVGLLQRGAGRGRRMAQGPRVAAAGRVRRGDSAGRDARVREALPAQLRRVPVPLLEWPHACARADAGSEVAPFIFLRSRPGPGAGSRRGPCGCFAGPNPARAEPP